MAIKPNLKLVVRQRSYHANMTDENHLGLTLQHKPEVVNPVINKLFTEYLYSDNPLQTILSKYTQEQQVDKKDVEWRIAGQSYRPCLVVEDTSGGNTVVGQFGSTFEVVLDVDWYKIGDVIAPWNADYPCRVESEAISEGVSKYRYKLAVLDAPTSRGFPAKFLTIGHRWAKIYSLYGEASERAGSTVVGTSMIAFRTRLNRMRKTYRITGDARDAVLEVGIVDSTGKLVRSWFSYLEAEFWRQWYREKEYAYWYGRMATNLQDANGYNVISGPGIHQIVQEHGHVHYYNKLTPQLLEEFLMDIYFGRLDPGPRTRRQVLIFTGEWGMKLFNDAVSQSILAKQNIFLTEGTVFQKTKSEYHDNAYTAGIQFTEYKFFNGASVKVIHNPIYDDLTVNGFRERNAQFPVSSANMLFLDLSGEGKTNISILKRRNSFKFGYVIGTTGPTGPVNGTNIAHAGDFYEMVVQEDCGIKIEDPTRLGLLKFNPSV